MIQQVEDFWNTIPCDSLYSDKEPGTKEYFNQIANYRYTQIPEILEFADFPKWKGRTVLEVGCGIGTDTVQFARAGAKVTALDLSPQSLSLTYENLTKADLFAYLHKVNIEEITDSSFYRYNSQEYSLIYSFGVIHHTPNPKIAFKQIRLLCSEHTEVRIMLYAKWSLHTLWVLLRKGGGQFWKLNQLLQQNAETQYGCPVAYHYTFSDVRKLMEGYNILSIRKGYLSWSKKFIPKILHPLLARMLGGYIFIVAKAKSESAD